MTESPELDEFISKWHRICEELDTTNFYCSYEVSKNPDNSISGLIERVWGEVKPIYPTACDYKKVEYTLILQE